MHERCSRGFLPEDSTDHQLEPKFDSFTSLDEEELNFRRKISKIFQPIREKDDILTYDLNQIMISAILGTNNFADLRERF